MIVKDPPHVKCIATLFCEISVYKKFAMLKNSVNKLPRETQTAMQDSTDQNCSRKQILV